MLKKIQEMERAGLVRTTEMPTTFSALRSNELWLYRIQEKGRLAAAASRGELRRVLVAIAKSPLEGEGDWAVEHEIVPRSFPGTRDLYYARHRLKVWSNKGYIERKKTRPPATARMICLTPEGEKHLQALRRAKGMEAQLITRAPRTDQAIHHLLVVSAAIFILRRMKAHFVHLYGDEDIRSAARKGRVMKAGSEDEQLPDGRLFLKTAEQEGDGKAKVDIEILVSKYTDEQILSKYEALSEAGTLFFSPTKRLCDRVEALTGKRPWLLQ